MIYGFDLIYWICLDSTKIFIVFFVLASGFQFSTHLSTSVKQMQPLPTATNTFQRAAREYTVQTVLYFPSQQMNVTGGTFRNCQAANGLLVGGAIYVKATAGGIMEVSNCTFDSCSAPSYGGAVYAWVPEEDYETANFDLDIDGCKFLSCKVGDTSSDGNQKGFGGAVSTQVRSLRLGGCTFSSCTGSHAGAVFLIGYTFLTQVLTCTFENCRTTSTSFTSPSDLQMGTVYLLAEGGEFEIVNCTFEGNFAELGGGGIGMERGREVTSTAIPINVSQCLFNNQLGQGGQDINAGLHSDLGEVKCPSDICAWGHLGDWSAQGTLTESSVRNSYSRSPKPTVWGYGDGDKSDLLPLTPDNSEVNDDVMLSQGAVVGIIVAAAVVVVVVAVLVGLCICCALGKCCFSRPSKSSSEEMS